MPRTFYTERDIEDLVQRGVRELVVTDDVYVTDVARERAEKLELKLVSGKRQTASSPAPQAPYGQPALAATLSGPSFSSSPPVRTKEELFRRVKEGVIARLGKGADEKVVERIVQRVVELIP